ncbi:WxL domain-containing protein [Enterococcus sp. LJL120]
MKMKSFFKASILVLLFSSFTVSGVKVYANSFDGLGSVTVTDTGVTTPVDPENPGNEVDPGPGPSTTGELRIDFASSLNFGSGSTAGTNRSYTSLAQLFYNDVSARGYYIQVTDRRGDASGWTLSLSQDTQFTSGIIQDLDNQELKGAELTFGSAWANTSGNSGVPSVIRETKLTEMNTAYNIVTAGQGQGKGVWTVSFGASAENQSDQPNTLTALKDSTGDAVIDTTYNKPAYSNSAITLTVPDTTKIYPVQYTTTLTWTLEAGPTE